MGILWYIVLNLIKKIEDNLKDNNPFAGDSADANFIKKMDDLFVYLNKVRNLEIKDCTIVMKDLLDNSFI